MIEMLGIFAALVFLPMLLATPFLIFNFYKEKKEKEAERIINRLKGIPDGPVLYKNNPFANNIQIIYRVKRSRKPFGRR